MRKGVWYDVDRNVNRVREQQYGLKETQGRQE